MVDNVKTPAGEVWYGLHFRAGTAEYKDGNEVSRVFISEAAAKKMDPTMAGKPVVVDHIEELPKTSDGVKSIADGFVSESFYCPEDGAHWAKFIAVTDRAKDAIRKGWRLSNAYKPTEFGQRGKNHAVEYDREILNGEYEHLALVENPRYEESKILNPEQFKQYCMDKKTEIARLANSKDKQTGEKSVLNIFKRTKVENSADFDEMMVKLPKSGREMTLTTLVNEMDKFCNAEGYANPDHLVKVGNEEMSVKEMSDCYGKMKSSMEEEEMKKKNKKKNEADAAALSNAEMEEKWKEEMKNMSEEEKEDFMKKKKNEGKFGDPAKAEADAVSESYSAKEKKMNSDAEYERIKNKVEATKADTSSVKMHNEETAFVLPNHGVKKGLAAYGQPVSGKF